MGRSCRYQGVEPHVQRPRGRGSKETSGQWVQGGSEAAWGGGDKERGPCASHREGSAVHSVTPGAAEKFRPGATASDLSFKETTVRAWDSRSSLLSRPVLCPRPPHSEEMTTQLLTIISGD